MTGVPKSLQQSGESLRFSKFIVSSRRLLNLSVIRQGQSMTSFDEFVSLLARLDAESWNATITEEPEWKWLHPRSRDWEFGRFAALFVVLGLNDYQTKGKADVGYWPKVVPLVPRTPPPESPADLAETLEPFFERERFGTNKVARLHRFTESTLCAEIWSATASELADSFPAVWKRLGRTMNQPATKKTIAFAMKCLALALLMVDEKSFDFSAVPVPVDSRIRSVSARLGLGSSDEETERNRWQAALNQIRATRPEVTMVHLDSILWQIGTLSSAEITFHLKALGATALASEIAGCLGSVAASSSVSCHAS
jgi:DNA-(apurinic or apyrimidinic site) lyase